MKISLVKIGNSKGVILPKPIRSLVGLSSDTAELSVDGNSIVISPVNRKTMRNSTGNSRRKVKTKQANKAR